METSDLLNEIETLIGPRKDLSQENKRALGGIARHSTFVSGEFRSELPVVMNPELGDSSDGQ